MADIYDMADTWNAAGTTFTAIKMNVTDTASAAGSLLMDLQIGGASLFKVSKSGQLLASNGTQAAPGLSFITNPGTGLVCFGDILGITTGGLRSVYIDGSQIRLRSTGTFGWAPDGNNNSAGDLFLERDAAGVVRIAGAASAGGVLQLKEMTAPSAPAANNVRIFSQDNGAGKTQLMALFPTGAAVQIAIEP